MRTTATAASPAGAIEPADILGEALNAAPGAAAVFDTAGALVFTNPAWARLNLAPVDGATPFDLPPLADATSKAFVQIERFRAGKLASVRETCQLLRADGQSFWADLSLVRMAEAGLTVVQINDIDVSVRHDELIAEQNARWETALEAAGQGMWEFDRSTNTVAQSRGWKKMRGYGPDDYIAMEREAWLSRVHPEDRERINRTSEQQGAGDGEFETIEYRERHRDGHYIWIYSRGRPYTFDDEGNPIKAIGTDTDITRLKTIEAELAAEKERLRVTLQSINDGVIATDTFGRVLFINEAAQKMTGWSAAEAKGMRVDDVFSTEMGGAVDSHVAHSVTDCLRDGRTKTYKDYSLLRSRDGTERYIREKASPIWLNEDRMMGVVVVFDDATKRRELRMQLEHAATHDQLTGLPNRVGLEHHMNEAIASAGEDGTQHAVFVIDLDHFKAVNDGAGHAAGDALLQQLGPMLSARCRPGDCVARIGGDEFVVVLHDCNLSTARRIAQRMIDDVEEMEFRWQEQVFHIGASIGIAQVSGKGLVAEDLYRQADSACYSAKRNGRNCVVVGG